MRRSSRPTATACAALEALRKLAPVGARVTLAADPALDDRDRYGRPLRYVFAGGTNVNVALVRRGAASPYFFRNERGRYAGELLDAVADAREPPCRLLGRLSGSRAQPGPRLGHGAVGGEARRRGGARRWRLLSGDVEIDGDGVVAVGRTGRPGSGIAAPGFVDLQVNGIAGVDFLAADEAGYATACEALLATGVTTVLPTLVTASEEVLRGALGALPRGECAARGSRARISKARSSRPRASARTTPPHRRDPDPALLERLLAAGPVALMTLAPELTGALELVDLLRARGVPSRSAIPKPPPTRRTLAFDRGARGVTHVFNAMPPLAGATRGSSAQPSPRAMTSSCRQSSTASISRARSSGCSAPAWAVALRSSPTRPPPPGLGDGPFTLGGQPLVVERGVARREDGVLAGSTRRCRRPSGTSSAHDVPLESALEAASACPRGVLGRPASRARRRRARRRRRPRRRAPGRANRRRRGRRLPRLTCRLLLSLAHRRETPRSGSPGRDPSGRCA